MNLERKSCDTHELLTVSGDLSIGDATALKDELQKLLLQDRDAVIDIDGVSSCDTSIVQLFYSLHKTTETGKASLKFQGESQAMRDTAMETGFDYLKITNRT